MSSTESPKVSLLEEKGIITKEEVLKCRQKTLEEKGQTEANEGNPLKAWEKDMRETDAQMPRNVEDLYDALISNGMPLESFDPFIQKAYKAKKEARKRRPI